MALLCGISFLNLVLFAVAGGMKNVDGAGTANKNQIVIKDFHFTPESLTVIRREGDLDQPGRGTAHRCERRKAV